MVAIVLVVEATIAYEPAPQVCHGHHSNFYRPTERLSASSATKLPGNKKEVNQASRNMTPLTIAVHKSLAG